jgi:hypothetical protein
MAAVVEAHISEDIVSTCATRKVGRMQLPERVFLGFYFPSGATWERDRFIGPSHQVEVQIH